MIKIYGSSDPGGKYRYIYERLNIFFEYIDHNELLVQILKFKPAEDVKYYHLRYLNLDSILKYFFYLIFPILLRLNKIKLVWTIHNFFDHHSSKYLLNKLINYYLVLFSHKCIVMHSDIRSVFPPKLQKKILVANFVSLEPKAISKPLFTDAKYIKKLDRFIPLTSTKPILLSISTAKHNSAYLISKHLNNNIKLVFVDPYGYFKNKMEYSNQLLYIENYIGIDFLNALIKRKYPIGLVGHNNISVPTSIFMFAAMGIPVLGLNYLPVSSIINDSNIGIVLKDINRLDNTIDELLKNIDACKKNLKTFLEKNNWEKTIEVHKKVFN